MRRESISIKSMGARAFGGTTIPMPDDPTNFQACDHGFAEWFFPPRARKHPMVLVHGSSTRTYQTTFDGQPGFQSIFLADEYPVYLVDLPWTGRAGKACEEYTWNPVNPGFSARFVFTNRVGLWPVNTPVSNRQLFPGRGVSTGSQGRSTSTSATSMSSSTRATNNERESTALAVLLEEVYKERGTKAILHTHSSSHARGLLVAQEDRQARRPNRLGTERRSGLPGRRAAAADPARRWCVGRRRDRNSSGGIPQAHQASDPADLGRLYRQDARPGKRRPPAGNRGASWSSSTGCLRWQPTSMAATSRISFCRMSACTETRTIRWRIRTSRRSPASSRNG